MGSGHGRRSRECSGRQWTLQLTKKQLVQGEDRDSSDEEWANAYARMDPASQLGWRNCRCGVEGPGEQLMRDVLEAADVLHSDAMSEMDANIHNIDERDANADAHGGGHMSRPTEGSRSPTTSVEVDQEGA